MAEHNVYCDKEMAETKQKAAELNNDFAKPSSWIDKASAESAKLKGDDATLAKELSGMARLQAEADSLRQEKHGVHLQAKADLEQGVEEVRLAL